MAERNDQEFKSYIKKLCPFTDCMSEINNKQTDNANGLDVVVPMYNLIQYSDNYSKILRGLWQFCKNEADYNILNCSNSNQDLQTITVF